MILLICNSNMFVPGVVTRVLKSPQEQFVIYTDMSGMEKFFREMTFPNAEVLRYPNNYTLWTLHKAKREMLNQLRIYNIEQIEFYHTEAGQLANWLITKYSGKSKIIYRPPYKPFPFAKLKGFERYKIKLIDWVLYHYDPDPLVMGKDEIITSIPQSFFKRNNINIGEYSVDYQLNKRYLENIYPLLNSSKTVVLLTGGNITSGVDPDRYDKLIKYIIDKIGEKKIVKKCHPLFDDEYGIEKKLPSLPTYIPMNMIVSMFDVIIGFGSTALVEAAEAGKLSISTVFLVPMKDGRKNMDFYKSLELKNTGEKRVFYPKTVEELDSLLDNK